MANDIVDLLNEKKQLIDEVIKKYLPEKFDQKYLEWSLGKARYSYNVEALQKVLSEPIWDFLNRGGKRWRPALFLLISEALGADLKKVREFVVISELVHNGSLVVDDLEDRSELRRGQPCMHIKYGTDIAVNAGNMMYFLPFLALMKNKYSFSSDTIAKAYQVCIQELINIHAGQGLDIAWHNGLANADNINEQEYLQMCAYKTGTLARLSARLAVVLAGGYEKQEDVLGKFAETIGVAFQIQDDILNLTATSGKNNFTEDQIGSDITEGKRTLMVINTLSKASEEDKKELIEILNLHTNNREKIGKAIEILKKSGSVEYSKNYAKEMVRNSWAEANKILPESIAKGKLKKFADFLVEREW